jgi:hypothetical protein
MSERLVELQEKFKGFMDNNHGKVIGYWTVSNGELYLDHGFVDYLDFSEKELIETAVQLGIEEILEEEEKRKKAIARIEAIAKCNIDDGMLETLFKKCLLEETATDDGMLETPFKNCLLEETATDDLMETLQSLEEASEIKPNDAYLLETNASYIVVLYNQYGDEEIYTDIDVDDAKSFLLTRPENWGGRDIFAEIDMSNCEDVIAVYRGSERIEILDKEACQKIDNFLTLRAKYQDKIITSQEWDVIAETPGITIEDLGGSGLHPDRTWYLVKIFVINNSNETDVNEFSVYL